MNLTREEAANMIEAQVELLALRVLGCQKLTEEEARIAFGFIMLGLKSAQPESAAMKAIREHNDGCDAACKAQRPTDAGRAATTGCGYQRADGSLIYGLRNCPTCPTDWKIDVPQEPR